MLKEIYRLIKKCKLEGKHPSDASPMRRMKYNLRAAVRVCQKEDLLQRKWDSGYYGHTHTERYECYSPDGGKTWSRTPFEAKLSPGTEIASRRVRLWPVYYETEKGTNAIMWISSLTHWFDEILELKRKKIPLNHAHEKGYFFRVNGEYYLHKDYFEHEGKAYLKSQYVLQNGQIYDKANTCMLDFRVSDWQFREIEEFRQTFALVKPDDNTQFKENMRYGHHVGDDAVMEFCYCYHSSDNSYFDIPDSFFTTMFKTNGIRYTSNNRHCYLSKKEILDLEFAPMKAHKELVELVQNKFNEHIMSHKSLPEDYRQKVIKKMDFKKFLENNVRVEARFLDGVPILKGAGIMANIYKQLFTFRNNSHDHYTLNNFMKRIEILKEIFKKENENETSRLQRERA